MSLDISIIIPCYNQEKYLDRCLNSVLFQSFSNWVCLIVNDRSTDNTKVLANKWCDKDRRFILQNKSNGGLSDARNYGIENAKGIYLFFLDSDDSLTTSKSLESLYNYTQNNVEVVSANIYLEYENGETKPSTLNNFHKNALYINVRRGEYYLPKHKDIYGFDIIGFLKHSFTNYIDKQEKINIISNDMQWCRDNLQFIDKFENSLVFMEKSDPLSAFLSLSSAKNLLLSNSTFAYWGAYISTILNHKANIMAPNFIHRNQTKTKQYLKSWNTLEGFNYNNSFK